MIKNNINKLFLSLFLFIYSSYIFGANQQPTNNTESPLNLLWRAIEIRQNDELPASDKEMPELIALSPIVERSTALLNDTTKILENTKKSKPTKRKHSNDAADNYDENDFNNNGNTSDDDYEDIGDEFFTPKRFKNMPVTYSIDESTGKKIFKCPWENCKYTSNRLVNLTRHMQTHTHEKSYKKLYICPHPNCHYTSIQSSNIKRHERTHTNERPYKCTHLGCNYAAATTNTLTTHERTHTGERPYKCTHLGCNYTAAQLTNFKIHINMHIKNEHKQIPSQMQENETNNTTNPATTMGGV